MEKEELEKLTSEISKQALLDIKEAVKENLVSQIDKLKEKFVSVGEFQNEQSKMRELTKQVKDLETISEKQKEIISNLLKDVKEITGRPVPITSGSKSRLGTLLDEEE